MSNDLSLCLIFNFLFKFIYIIVFGFVSISSFPNVVGDFYFSFFDVRMSASINLKNKDFKGESHLFIEILLIFSQLELFLLN